MKVLVMKKEYLLDILNGKKTYDARSYDTSIRGNIALLASENNKIYGFVDLYDVKEITFEEYLTWHNIDKEYFSLYKKQDKYYAYLVRNPRFLSSPIKINRDHNSEFVWCEVDDDLIKNQYIEVRLF